MEERLKSKIALRAILNLLNTLGVLTPANIPEKRYVKLQEEHKILEHLLQVLGYGGKVIQIPAYDSKKETIKEMILIDKLNGLDIQTKSYPHLIQDKLKEIGIKANKREIKALINELNNTPNLQ